MLTDYLVEKRCQLLGEYIVKTGATVRAAAAAFAISKSTVHKDITEKLEKINPTLSRLVKEVLDKDISEAERQRRKNTKVLRRGLIKINKKDILRGVFLLTNAICCGTIGAVQSLFKEMR